MKYCFRPINLEKDRKIVGDFLLDAFSISGISISSLEAPVDVYCNSIVSKQNKNPKYCALLLENNEVIGLVDAHVIRDQKNKGLVSFYYLVPQKRGHGIGKILEEYAVNLLRECGCRYAYLEVADSNEGAIRFYKKNGWHFVESISKRHLKRMEKKLDEN